jgi:methionyl-tRNA formyltransferase
MVFMGTPEFAVPSLEGLIAEGYDVVGVLTQPDRPAGRGRQLEQSPVKRAAIAHGITVQQPKTLRDGASREALAALAPDVIVVAAYGLILPQEVLALPRFGCVNVHGSLLPRHRGAAPIAAAILAGDAETGVSIMLMDAGVDTGPVLGMGALPIAPDDTAGSLSAKLAALGAELLVQTLPGWLAGTLAPRPQPEGEATYAPRIEKEEGRIDWSEPAALIERRVRAYQPWPTAYTSWRDQPFKILHARAASAYPLSSAAPDTLTGQVVGDGKKTAGVVTGEGILWLEEVQPAGKRAMPVASFLQGAPAFVGSRLGG